MDDNSCFVILPTCLTSPETAVTYTLTMHVASALYVYLVVIIDMIREERRKIYRFGGVLAKLMALCLSSSGSYSCK